MQVKVNALKVCDVQECRSLQEGGKRYINMTILVNMEIDGKVIHKTLDCVPGSYYDIETFINEG